MITIRKETLKVLSKLAFAIKDETRGHLFNTVRLEIESENDQLVAISTNGLWLVKFNLQDEGLSTFVKSQPNKAFNYQPIEKFTCKKTENNKIIEITIKDRENIRDYVNWRILVPSKDKTISCESLGMNLTLFSELNSILKVYAPHLRTKLSFYGDTRPIRIDPVGNTTFMALIMPLKL